MTQIDIIPKISETFEPGAILENSWGYEQTNIEFYCIIERSRDWVKILPMTKNVSEERGFMSYYSTAGKINWNAKPQRKKIKTWNGKEHGFSFGNYTGAGWCKLWNGKESLETHYA